MTDGEDWPLRPFESDGSDSRVLRRQHRETRAVLDHQIETLEGMDDTAMRTARIAVLLLAVVLSAVRLSDGGGVANGYVLVGSVGLTVTFALGVFTYGTSSADLGPNPGYIEAVLSRTYSERQWPVLLRDYYADAVEDARRTVYWNGVSLQVTQLLLVLPVGSLAVGIGQSVDAFALAPQ